MGEELACTRRPRGPLQVEESTLTYSIFFFRVLRSSHTKKPLGRLGSSVCWGTAFSSAHDPGILGSTGSLLSGGVCFSL